MNHGGKYGDATWFIRFTAFRLGGLVRPSDIISDWFPTQFIASKTLFRMVNKGLAECRPVGTMPGRWEPCFKMLPAQRRFAHSENRTPIDL